MKNLNNNFIRGMRWNAFETFTYQTILLLDYIFLFKVTDSNFYGLICALISILYLLVNLLQFGLDLSLAPFFTIFSKSKKHFKILLNREIIPQIILLLAFPLFIYIAKENIISYLASYFPKISILKNITNEILILLSFCVSLEGIKKILRSFLQLPFYNKKTAIAEVISVIIFTSLVWGKYYLTGTITLYGIFVPFLISSFVSLIILLKAINIFYQSLPEDNEYKTPNNINKRILKSRFFNYLNEISNLFFSSNFLTPFLATRFGLGQAGIFQIINEISHFVISAIRKIFGSTGTAYLSNIREDTLLRKQKVFYDITNRLYQVLYFIFIFLVINHKKLLSNKIYQENHMIITFYISLTFLENFFLLYNKFYITEEKAEQLLFFNILNISFIYFIINFSNKLPDFYILFSIILIRIFIFILLSLFSYLKWKIKPGFKMKAKYFVTSLAISVIFYLFI